MDIEGILQENERRNALRQAPFDPLSGLNSIGPRTELLVPDFVLPRQYIPPEMETDPLVAALRDCGSLHALAARGRFPGLTPEELADRLLRLRMRCDFPFWAASAVFIKRKAGGDDTRFVLNLPQRRLVGFLEERRLAGKPIRVILLKARQWGGSTCIQLYMAWLQLLHSKGLNSLIVAHQGAASDEIKDMFDRMITAYPPELLFSPSDPLLISGKGLRQKKMVNVGKTGCIFRVPPRNCKIKIGSAESPEACRGGDYNLVHLSEVGIWPDTPGKSPEDLVGSACGGVLLAPLTMIIFESTAKGTGNFFHREYLAARRGESQFDPLFIPWHEIEQYSLPLDGTRRRELAGCLLAGRDSRAETPRSESGRYLWNLFLNGATLESIAWYVAERAKYNTHERMASEYPSDDTEAFVHSGARVFDRYKVEELRAGCTAPRLTGEVVSPFPDGPDSLRRDSLRLLPSGGGSLSVWELPAERRMCTSRYLVVVDVGGRSPKADWSVICVLDRAPLLRGGVPAVCAQWRGHCDADILAWNAARIARFYDDALLVIESNTLETREGSRNLDGNQAPYILTQIRDAYPNLYARAGSADALREARNKLGFHTNANTKPLVISTLIRAVRDKLYSERCPEALDEMTTYERRANGSFGAIAGAHDDILMTRAIALHISMHEMDFPREISRNAEGSAAGRSLSARRKDSRRPDCAF